MKDLTGKTWLITGGAGFIGSNLVRHVIDRGATVINLDALTYAGNMNSLSDLPDDRHIFVHGSIGDRQLVSDLLNRHQPEAILNLAAESHVDRSIDSPAEFLQTNVIGTAQLLDAVLAWWRTQGQTLSAGFRFLHVSTDEVYGSVDTGEFTEESAYRPNSPYAASKAASDHIVRAYHVTYGLPTLVSNCSNNYGPYQFPEKLIPHIVLSALEEKPLPVYGDGSNVRDWLHVGDHCSALCELVETGKVGDTYNIGGEAEYANIDVVRAICRILDAECPRKNGESHEGLITFVADRPGHDKRYAINCDKLKSESSWRQSVDFQVGLTQTVRWYMDNRTWWQPIREGRYQGDRLGTR